MQKMEQVCKNVWLDLVVFGNCGQLVAALALILSECEA